MTLRRSRLWPSLAVLGSLTLAAFTRPAILRLGHNRPRFPYSCTPLAPAAYDALASRPGWSRSTLSVAPDISLNGLIRRPARAAAPWVLFFPGNDASQLTAGQELVERLREERDWGAVVYADRGFDSSGGEPDAENLREDGYRILTDVLARERLEPKQLHVVAFSMGGYVAAAAVGRAAKEHRVVASLSTLAAVESMEMVRAMWMSRIALGDLIDTLPLLDDVPGPVLVLHGAADQTLPVQQGRDIAARLGSRARFEEIVGCGHLDINQNDEAIRAVRAMIEGHTVL